MPMGVGMGLTFDEAALLLDLRDVYWTREGLLSVQLSLGATAILSIAILTQRMLRRGERRQEAEGLIPPADHLSAEPSRWRTEVSISFPPIARNRACPRWAFGLLGHWGPGRDAAAAGP